MKINFYPEYDNPEYVSACDDYRKIWEDDGNKIVETLERISGLKFQEKVLNAIIHDRRSGSHPLVFRHSYDLDTKKSTIIHELSHRLCTPNNTRFDDPQGDVTKEVHKIIFLILYDAICEIYDKNLAIKEVQTTKSYNRPAYNEAWDYALGMSKEDRAKTFASLLAKS